MKDYCPDQVKSELQSSQLDEGKLNVPNALTLMDEDFQLISSLRSSQQNFVLTDPNKYGNPIVYANARFLDFTGYNASDIIGKNLQILTGPATDPTSLNILKNNLDIGQETSLCLLCYRANGMPFWNQIYIGALRDQFGRIANLVACMSEITTMPHAEFHKRLRRVPLPQKLFESHDIRGQAALAARSVSSYYSSMLNASQSSMPFINVSPFMKFNTVNGKMNDKSSFDNDDNVKKLVSPKSVDPLKRTRSSIRANIN
jgi:PAS domain S-box-containing protein